MLQPDPRFYCNNTAGNPDHHNYDPDFAHLEGQLSLPDLGGVSVDFANYEDYQRLQQPQFNLMGLAPIDSHETMAVVAGLTRNRS